MLCALVDRHVLLTQWRFWYALRRHCALRLVHLEHGNDGGTRMDAGCMGSKACSSTRVGDEYGRLAHVVHSGTHVLTGLYLTLYHACVAQCINLRRNLQPLGCHIYRYACMLQ